jgi:hypothetical protein
MRRHHVFVTGYSIGGAIALVLGTAHFFLPNWGYDGLVLQLIPEIPRDHFVYLGTYAIGLFLVSVGVMSFHFAKLGGSQTAKLFAALQAAFWAARVLLEVRYPSHLQIFFLSEPPFALGAISAIAFVSYSAAFSACLAPPARVH